MRISVSVFLFLTISFSAFAQSGRKITRSEYIDTYKDLAMREMERVKIPASITLAQGILESGNGNSRLARKGNNHFGIKCHGWEGKSMRHDDDAKNECFRKYKSVEESYHDHSEFLANRSRYASLFELEIEDYKAWAKGLKKAGYATSPTYAKALIKLIEENNLQQYDQQVLAKMEDPKQKKTEYASTEYMGSRKVFYNNRVKYVLAREGDTFDELSEELDLFNWQLPKYNESDFKTVFAEGDKVYLQPKRNKAQTGIKTHMVQEGETLHNISQIYAMKESKLRERNDMGLDEEPKTGQVILLRGRVTPFFKSKPTKKIEVKDEQVLEDSEFKVVIEELDE